MPKLKSAKNNEPTRVGVPVDLEAWLTETETIKAKDGTETTVRKNLSDSVYADIKDGERTKDKDGRVIAIVSKEYKLNIKLANRKIAVGKEKKLFDKEYAELLANVGEACAMLVGGNVDITVTKDKDGKETEQPSVTKYFNQGFGMLARNNASASIAAEVEGPAKGTEQAIKGLMRSKGWSYEKAKQRLAELDAD